MSRQLLLILVLCALACGSPARAAAPAKSATLANLQAVYAAAMKAKTNYREYAKLAQAEGYPKAAKLLVAAAMSAEIRSRYHAEAIQALKASPQPGAGEAGVAGAGTRENLEAVLAEVSARVAHYPGWVKQAQADHARQAVLLFKGDWQIQEALVVFLKQVLAEPAQGREDGAFYTCEVCGTVAENLDFDFCAYCKEGKRHYIVAE